MALEPEELNTTGEEAEFVNWTAKEKVQPEQWHVSTCIFSDKPHQGQPSESRVQYWTDFQTDDLPPLPNFTPIKPTRMQDGNSIYALSGSIPEDYRNTQTLAMGYEELGTSDIFFASGGTFSFDTGTVNPGGSQRSLRINPTAGTGYTTWRTPEIPISSITSPDSLKTTHSFGYGYVDGLGISHLCPAVSLRLYLYVDSLPASDTVLFSIDGDVSSFFAKITSAGLIKWYHDTTLLGTTSVYPIATGSWYRIEAIAQTGTATATSLKINEFEEIATTATNSNTTFDSITLGCTTGTNTYDVYFDDVKAIRSYTTIDEYNSIFEPQYIGPGHVVYCNVSGVPNITYHVFNASNCDNVDEIPPDEGTTKDSSSTAGAQLYPIALNDDVQETVYTVFTCLRAKGADANTTTLKSVRSYNGLVLNGLDFEIQDSYAWRLVVLDNKNDEGWSRAALEDVETGIQVPATSTFDITTVGFLVDTYLYIPDSTSLTGTGGLVANAPTNQSVGVIGTGGLVADVVAPLSVEIPGAGGLVARNGNYANGYQYKTRYTILAGAVSDVDQLGFPYHLNCIIPGAVDSNFLFTDTSDVRLPSEVVDFNVSTGKLYAVVKVDIPFDADTTIWIYWGTTF